MKHNSFLTNTRERALARRSILVGKLDSEVTLLRRHLAVLGAIVENEPIGLLRLSDILSAPQHRVRYSLRVLHREGLIKPTPEGAVTGDTLEGFLHSLGKVLEDIADALQELREAVP